MHPWYVFALHKHRRNRAYKTSDLNDFVWSNFANTLTKSKCVLWLPEWLAYSRYSNQFNRCGFKNLLWPSQKEGRWKHRNPLLIYGFLKFLLFPFKPILSFRIACSIKRALSLWTRRLLLSSPHPTALFGLGNEIFCHSPLGSDLPTYIILNY